MEEKCTTCGMPIDDDTRCACKPDKCYHCCECDSDCDCGCHRK